MDFKVRKSIRLNGYDYSTPGAYFITICAYNRKNIFGEIVAGDIFNLPEIKLSEIGIIANDEILKIQDHYENIKVDKYTIMPNHIHMIIRITERINPFPTTKKYDVPNVVGKYKAAVSRNIGEQLDKMNIWQKSFYDHIIRTEQDYNEIWIYIDENPSKYAEGKFDEDD